MEKIASFTIDHIKLEPGVYVSRKDHVGAEVITTFDLRLTSPNDEPVMNTAEMHTIGCYLFKKSSALQGPYRLLWTDGLPHRFLSAVIWRPYFKRNRSTYDRNV